MRVVRILTLKENAEVYRTLPLRGGIGSRTKKKLILRGNAEQAPSAEETVPAEENGLGAKTDRLLEEKTRQNRFRALYRLRKNRNEDRLWECAVAFQNYEFKTYSGLPFNYTLKKGKNGKLTRELWVDRRANSKSLVWSSVLLAYRSLKESKEVIARPKLLGDIRGITYIYGIFYRFGLIDVPEWAKQNMTFSAKVFSTALAASEQLQAEEIKKQN